jgi:hypothetical protein
MFSRKEQGKAGLTTLVWTVSPITMELNFDSDLLLIAVKGLHLLPNTHH